MAGSINGKIGVVSDRIKASKSEMASRITRLGVMTPSNQSYSNIAASFESALTITTEAKNLASDIYFKVI